MRTRAVLLLALTSTTIAAALASCRAADDVPARDKLCAATSLVSEMVVDGGNAACVACFEDTACCDDVGRCLEEPECAGRVATAHRCIVGDGPRTPAEREPACIAPLGGTGDKARAAYDCMRKNCGGTCGLPVCRLDPTVRFISTASCDRCFGLSCCGEFNACMQNRECRLAIECIVTDCRRELEVALDVSQASEMDTLERRFCGSGSGGGRPNDGDDDSGRGPRCVDGCIEKYLGMVDGGGSTEELRVSTCLALRVRSCGARANCGQSCKVAPDDAGGDSD